MDMENAFALAEHRSTVEATKIIETTIKSELQPRCHGGCMIK